MLWPTKKDTVWWHYDVYDRDLKRHLGERKLSGRWSLHHLSVIIQLSLGTVSCPGRMKMDGFMPLPAFYLNCCSIATIAAFLPWHTAVWGTLGMWIMWSPALLPLHHTQFPIPEASFLAVGSRSSNTVSIPHIYKPLWDLYSLQCVHGNLVDQKTLFYTS